VNTFYWQYPNYRLSRLFARINKAIFSHISRLWLSESYVIHVFGASVTSQKNGYAQLLKEKLESFGNFSVNIFAYGGMHLQDAGVCVIDEVLESNPDICFFDWFSTGFLPELEELYIYLDTITRKCYDKNCRLIFLLLPRNPFEEGREKMYQNVIAYAKEHTIEYIDISQNYRKISDDNDILRDSIHTNENGSQMYFDLVFHFLSKNLRKQPSISKVPAKNKYSEIQSTTVSIEATNFIRISGPTEVYFMTKRGPYSSIIMINKDEEVNTWDSWCHYERDSLLNLIALPKKENLIEVSDKVIDKRSARQQVPDCQKKLIIKKMYYIGEEPKILGYQ